MDFKTDKSRVLGLGTAKEGVEHWWGQRVTSVALIPLLILFLFPFAGQLGAGHAAVLATYAHPLHAIIAILTIGVTFLHLKQGLQVVIEDYVPQTGIRVAALLATTLLCWLFGLTGVFAVIKIALGA